jgi:hypothetical protein
VNPAVPSTAISVRLPSAGLKSLTDSITDLKTTVAPLVKMMGQVKDSMIPSLTPQVTDIDDLVGKVIYDVRALEKKSVNILGTLEAQDQDTTNLEARFKLLEEQTTKIMRGKYLGDAAVVTSDEEKVEDNTEGYDNSKLRNKSLNVIIVVIRR